jgi:predicted ferric reductase
MLTTSRIHHKTFPVTISVFITIVIWLGSKWYFKDWFDDPNKYIAKAASLSATILMCWCILLSTRNYLLENFFGGLDKVYQIHKRIGRLGFFLIILHPVFVALLIMFILMAFTLWIKIPYHYWKKMHEWFGLVILLVVLHVIVVNKDVTAYPLLAVWVYGFLAIALVSFIYIRFLYKIWGPRFIYTVISSRASLFILLLIKAVLAQSRTLTQ